MRISRRSRSCWSRTDTEMKFAVIMFRVRMLFRGKEAPDVELGKAEEERIDAN